jgi:4'-phosphopantetheinyl transferase
MHQTCRRNLQWTQPLQMPLLEPAEVHVWKISWSDEDIHLRRLQGILSPDERQKGNRFYFQKDRRRFIAVHACLRLLLGHYLQIDAASLQFDYGAHGKPSVASESLKQKCSFNISHSRNLALLAFSGRQTIGVDVESIQPHLADEQIAKNLFAPEEIATLRSLPPHLRDKAFFSCWTRKEAYLKATGEGLSDSMNRFIAPMHQFEVSCFAGIVEHAEDNRSWFIWHLEPAPGYVGALATDAAECSLQLLEISPDYLAATGNRLNIPFVT